MHYAFVGDARGVFYELASGSGIDEVDKEGNSAIHYACSNPYLEFLQPLRLLLAMGANPSMTNSKGWTPSAVASNRKHKKQCALLHAYKQKEFSEEKAEELIFAAMSGIESSVLELLNKNPTLGLDVVDDEGLTPLMHAVKRADYSLVETLLLYGADPEIVDKGGNTAERYAQMKVDTDIEKLINSNLSYRQRLKDNVSSNN